MTPSKPYADADAVGSTQPINDENACPNKTTKSGRKKGLVSPRSGPSVAKIAALFDANKSSSNNANSSSPKRTRLKKKGLSPRSAGNNVKASLENKAEKEQQRRRLLLRECHSPKGLSPQSILEAKNEGKLYREAAHGTTNANNGLESATPSKQLLEETKSEGRNSYIKANPKHDVAIATQEIIPILKTAESTPKKNDNNMNGPQAVTKKLVEREHRRRQMLQERRSAKHGLGEHRSSSSIEEEAKILDTGSEIKLDREAEGHDATKAKIQKNASDGEYLNLLVEDHAHPTTKEISSPSSSMCVDKAANSDSRIPRVVTFASQIILLVSALYEVQHYYFLSPAATIFDIISEMTGWDDVFHVGFVFAFGIRALIASFTVATGRLAVKDEKGRVVSRYVHTILLFFFFASSWMVLLPIFKDCGYESINNHFCLFIERSSKRMKGKKVVAHHVFNITNPRYSALDILAREWYARANFVIKSKVKGRVMREFKRALWRPFTFRGRLKKLFMILRWAKFLAPLVGTCNKFRGHILDMIKKRRQRIKSQAAQKRWDDLLEALSKRSKLERAILKVQKSFREKKESKAKRRFALMSPQRNTSNRVVAHNIRKRLVEEQNSSRVCLMRMEVLDSQRKMKRQVSQDERRNITKHKESERKLKKRLLLSPKTSFAVGWKYFTVACVALEISQIIFAPMLSGELKKMPLDKFLLKVLNASSLCGDKIKKTAAPSIFIPVINKLGDITCNASSLKQVWLVTAHIIATALVPIVNTIFFLDVFITFFTGELSSSGVLVPKPFFKRCILPGIGLQLIVNPTMIEISGLVKQAIVVAMHVGPSLCFHLLLACVPFAASCCDKLLDLIFDFVERQNKVVA